MKRKIGDLLKHLDGCLEEDAYISTVSEALYDLTFEDLFKGYSGKEDPISALHGIVFGNDSTEEGWEYFDDLSDYGYIGEDGTIYADGYLSEDEIMIACGSVSKENLKKMRLGNVILHGEDRGVIRENVAEVFINIMCWPLIREKSK